MSKEMTKRFQWIRSTIADSLRVSENFVNDALLQDKNRDILDKFLDGEGPPKFFAYYQTPDTGGQNEHFAADPILFLTYGDTEKIKDKAVWFLRCLPESKKQVNLAEFSNQEVVYGEITPNPVKIFNHLMQMVYDPMLSSDKNTDWGVSDADSRKEFLNLTDKFKKQVKQAIDLMAPKQENFKIDPEDLAKFENMPDNEKIPFFQAKFQQWIKTIENFFNEEHPNKPNEEADPGPKTELDYWRSRMQEITNWSEQLKSKDFNMVKNALTKHKQHQGKKEGQENINKLMLNFQRLDLALTDKLNEAKDNVKYLSTLEKFIEPLYTGTPQQIIDTLPSLMNAIKMIHTIARFYNTPDKMTGLFVKITNQMIKNCKEKIIPPQSKSEDVWKRPPAEIIEILGSCIKLNREYKEAYNVTKRKIEEMPKGKRFDFSETQIFNKFDMFVKRLQKLIEVFSNIQQFNDLSKHNLEKMDVLIGKFDIILNEFKKKRSKDLLDLRITQFDKDYVSFNISISQLDTQLQAFIDTNFNKSKSIEHSLKLLKKFESTIKRDALKHNLTSKYNTILHSYATELDAIQRVFNDHRTDPPMVRNMPEIAGKIIWSKHLFQKITGPIHMFPQNVINSTEIKKYYGNYNTLGKQLTINEMWYYNLWVNEIERSKAALQATLIVRHETQKKLYVNFDVDIMQLIREAKCLDRQGIAIPQNARIILLQEEKFKMYYNELLYVLKEYERIVGKIKPICQNLLAPHIADLQLKLHPGMSTLTWTSMNIDSYLHHVYQGLNKLEQLIINVNDIIENRIENNLRNISKVSLVSLPHENITFTLENFVSMQEEYINDKRNLLTSKNVEVERAVDDLIQTILNYPLDVRIDPVKSDETKRIKKFYFWYLYQALLNATQNSLNAMKYRVCGNKGQSQQLSPFFEVDVQLSGSEVRLNPSLQEIQKAINKAATAVLRCSKKLYNWDQQNTEDGQKQSLYEMIAQDREIVKVILLLTGSIQGTKNKVIEFMSKFSKYDWLWKNSISKSIKEFSKGSEKPQLQAYEDELKKFSVTQEDIEKIEPTFIIGAMKLKTQNLGNGLKAHCKQWKNHYSQDLHKKARVELDKLTENIKELSEKLLKTEVKDIDSLGIVMEKLEEIRGLQAIIDISFNPVLEMYTLLDNYQPGSIIDKDQMDARSMLRRNWDSLIEQAEKLGRELSVKQAQYLKRLKTKVKDLIKDVTDFRAEYEKNGPMVEGISPKEAIERLKRFDEQYQVREQQYKINRKGEELFGLQCQEYPSLKKTKAELLNLKKLYNLYSEVINSINQFQELNWKEEVTQEKLAQMEDAAKRYSELCSNLPKDLREWQAYKELKNSIENLKLILPIIQILKKDSIKDRHWEALNEKTTHSHRIPYDNNEIFIVQDLTKAKVLDLIEDIEEIGESAEKQKKIEVTLKEIEAFWDTREFEFGNWGKRDNAVLAGLSILDITEKLEEDQMTLSSINAQRHVAPFKRQVEELIRVFSETSETLDLWIKVQALWRSLEPVFTGGDIAKQMPLQAKQFAGIDKTWIKCMEKSFDTKKVTACCQADLLKDNLPDMQKKLEECQKLLEAYLEGKRKQFPRFYFVSNPTLLKILSQGSDPTTIQEDFEKLFDAITRVQFVKSTKKGAGPNEREIKAIMQDAGSFKEEVKLNANVKCEGNIESWLKSLEKEMQESVRQLCRKACSEVFGTSLELFVKGSISQVALMGIQVLWTQKITDALEKNQKQNKGLFEQKKREIEKMLVELSNLCLQTWASPIDRTKIETLVTIHVHQRDIAAELKVTSVNDFQWQKQTRLYWKQDVDHCIISITDWEQAYSYEFLGAKQRLCITPLTDRCYITLAQAMSMYYGGAPAGPAGTGKTETVKDLGRTLGIFVVVTNCSDQHRYRDMAKIFKGLVQSGLWGCFDEFNRIELEVLSVVAMQVEAIGAAKKQHVSQFMFPEEPNPIGIVSSVGYFITMNPGYAGRQELPENLKVLFRGVTMMMPDREIIIKVKLASVGYEFINGLSKKFNVLYRLCEEQLSKQRHYDFGLRNILSVLRTAGNTKRKQLTTRDPALLQNPERKELFEEMLLMRSLRDMNLSKLVYDDIALFEGLLKDIFPRQTSVEKQVYVDVESKIPVMLKKKPELIERPEFTLKIIQLYETALVRHGFMLVGPTASGKTTIMTLLTEALSECGERPYRITRMNPKAITEKEMYGVKSEISDDWIPGVFSTLWQKCNARNSKFNMWLTCDGPVDAIWIENLNTVLDDNKILTLANGERIPMTDQCKLVFEVENLNNASPATVSRCGQVYISASDLGYEALYLGWCQLRALERTADEAQILRDQFTKYFDTYKICDAVDKTIKNPPVMMISTPLKVINTLNLVNGLLKPLTSSANSNIKLSNTDYEKVVVYSLAWAIGGVYEAAQRVQFHEYLQTKNCPLPNKKENETIFDYYIHIEDGKVEYRLVIPDKWKPSTQKFKFSQLLLPTLDSWRAEYLINNILTQPRPTRSTTAFVINGVLLVGGSGTAKTSSVLMYASKFDSAVQLFKRINFSSATSPSLFQASIETECDNKIGKDFAPPQNKKMVVFVDDMSMPFVNKWGDQITLEIVRQLIEQGGFYWLEKSQRGMFKNIRNLSFIGAMNHPGGGRNDIPNRLKRQFFIFNMILPLSIEGIYGPIIRHQFKVDAKNSGLNEEVKKVIENLTSATIKLWELVKKYMLPTPAKFHYVFNMREISRVFKGILQIKREAIMRTERVKDIKPEVYTVGLWRHECERVFCDKLINSKDKDTVLNYIHDISLDSFEGLQADINEKFARDKIFLFCDFLIPDVKDEDGVIIQAAPREYEAVNDIEWLRKRCYECIEDYNAEPKNTRKLDLVLFDDAVKHLLRISRIIKMPRSSALLVGVGGSGKQSLTRLAASIGKMEMRQIELVKNYGDKDLREDLKKYFEITGRFGRPCCFMLTDSQVKKEQFLEYVNMILSTGEVPGLLAKDEKETFLGDARIDYVKEFRNTPDPPMNELYSYFVDRVRDNLHIVLCFSPVGQKFRDRSRKFPALFNECTIDWFLPWPEEALVSVAQTFIKSFKELDTPNETKLELMKHMGNVHLMVTEVCERYFAKMRRQVYVTPKSYLSYLQSYKSLYTQKYIELDKQESNFSVGVKKIDEASESIKEMKKALSLEEVQLKDATEKTETLLKELDVEQRAAAKMEAEVSAITQKCEADANQIAKQKLDAEKQLAAAIPAQQRAQAAVDSLDPASVVEMKTTKSPQEILKLNLDAVAIYFNLKLAPVQVINDLYIAKGVQVNFWKNSFEESGKFLLGPNFDFLKNLKSYDKDSINNETIELLEPLLVMGAEWFNETNSGKVSKAIAAITRWCMAVSQYHEKSQIVKPKKIKLAQEQGKLAIAEQNLAKSRIQLKKIKDKLELLNENSQRQMENKNQLELKAAKLKKKINIAETLINSLIDEKERWKKGASLISAQKMRLVGNCSLATAFISYCGPFNSDFRMHLATDKFIVDMKQRNIPVLPSLANELTSFLVDDATVGEWNLQGLPKDDLSIQNGIMVTNSTRYPLLIDPQGQGQNWIMKKYADSMDKYRSMANLNNPKFKDFFLKYCLEEGKTIIIEGIENEVDPVLDPVLEKQIIWKKSRGIIKIGGTDMDFNKNFLMFMTCRLPNPSFSPELSAKTTIIDFTVTQKGLEQQLLGKVISKEQKALEDSLNALLTDVNNNKKELQKLDKNLLQRLTESKGNLLDDTELMEVLNSTKTQAKEVAVKLTDAETKTKEINDKREQYRPVAIRGAALYFTMIEVSLVNWMYNSSLEQFLVLFNESIDQSDKAQSPSKRVDIIIKFLTKHAYKYVNRGLFEKDKITFVLMMCFKILITAGKINSNDVGLFLKAGAAEDIKARPKPTGNQFAFISEKAWLNIVAFSKHCFNDAPVATFKELPELIVKNQPGWQAFFEKNDPENVAIPDLTERLSQEKEENRAFMQLCLLRSVREDRTLVASSAFINSVLGTEFTEPISYPIQSIWAESKYSVPILFLLSAGADPTSAIDEFARKKKKFPTEKVSMGQGQEQVARKVIKSCTETGGWVILQNCQLGLKFMEETEQTIIGFINGDGVKPHEDFRLWITCEPHSRFPLGLLQKVIKVTNEPPKGLKAGLYKTFTTLITQQFLEKVDSPNWRTMIFTICFLHSIVIERRKFGSLGWCIPYEFNNSDLQASLMFVQKYLTNLATMAPGGGQQPQMNMTVVKYMVCEVQYGGRITDDLDRELFNAYGVDYLKQAMLNNVTTDYVFSEVGTEGSRERFKYKIPANPGVQLSKYIDYINTIPSADSPQVFGLHNNADLTFRLKESLEMINTIMETRPKDSSVGGGKTREEQVKEKAQDLLGKLPVDYIDSEVKENIRKLGAGNKSLGATGMAVPLNIFLYQEIARMQKVIAIVRKTLVDISDAIDGQIIMTPEILEAINAVFDAKVPTQWVYDATGAEIAWIIPTLAKWFNDLIERNKQLFEWMKGSRPNTYWLGGFFNPQGFLTAMKQEVTRMHKTAKVTGANVEQPWSLDDVQYSTTVKEKEAEAIKEGKDKEVEGVYIRDLMLEGCRWYKNGLDESRPREMFSPLPILHVTAINKKKTGDDKNSYDCPVYKYPRRTDKYLIFRVKLPCEGDPHMWKLRGVALLCAIQ